MNKSLIIKIIAVLLLIVLIISIILHNSAEHRDVIKEALNDTKIIKVYDYQTKELTDTFLSKDALNLINELNYSTWKESSSLNGDEKKYLLKLYADEDSEDIAEITIYESNDYVSVMIPEKMGEKTFKTNHDLKNIFKRVT